MKFQGKERIAKQLAGKRGLFFEVNFIASFEQLGIDNRKGRLARVCAGDARDQVASQVLY